MSALVVITAPAAEPVSLEEAKLHVKQDDDADDALISGLIAAARRHCEQRLDQAFVTTTFELKLDRFPCEHCGLIELDRAPLQSITHVKYFDCDGDEQTLDDESYQVDAASRPGRLLPAPYCYWPSTSPRLNAVTIRFVAGYGAAAAVPDTIKAAIKLLVGHWYKNREATVIGSISSNLQFTVDALLGLEWNGSYKLAGH